MTKILGKTIGIKEVLFISLLLAVLLAGVVSFSSLRIVEVQNEGKVIINNIRYDHSFSTNPVKKDALIGILVVVEGIDNQEFVIESESMGSNSRGIACVSAKMQNSNGLLFAFNDQEFNTTIPCPSSPSSRTSSGGYICYHVTKDADGCAIWTGTAVVSRSNQCVEMGYSSSVPGPFATEVEFSCSGVLSEAFGGHVEPLVVDSATSPDFALAKNGVWNIDGDSFPIFGGFNLIVSPTTTPPPTTTVAPTTIPPTTEPPVDVPITKNTLRERYDNFITTIKTFITRIIEAF